MPEGELPLPPIDADVDLRDFQFMPLDVDRLRDSDLAALETPEACWAAVLLWCASWHQVPAASLPDDDRVLSNLSGYGRVVSEWKRVRAGALRGWVKCSDGRLYHTVVVEKAGEAWRAKLTNAYDRECDRIRKQARRHGITQQVAVPTFEQWNKVRVSGGNYPESVGQPLVSGGNGAMSGGHDLFSGGQPPEIRGTSAGNPAENALKGQGQGYSESEFPPNPPSGGNGAHPRSGRKPRDVRNQSAVAWDRVLEAAQKGRSTVGDALIDQAARRVGGYSRLGQALERDRTENKRRFREAYEELLGPQPGEEPATA